MNNADRGPATRIEFLPAESRKFIAENKTHRARRNEWADWQLTDNRVRC